MRYITAGSPIINDFRYSDGRYVTGRLGGSVVYALYGLAMCGENPIFAQKVGHDFESFYGKWMDDNGYSREGLIYGDEDTTYLEVHYSENGLWEHRPVKKADGTFYNQKFAMVSPEVMEPFVPKCGGIFINSNVTHPFWKDMLDMRDRYKVPLMWEIGTQDFLPELRKEVFALMKKCDYYSMNFEEAKVLFNTQSEEEILRSLCDLRIPCFFRAGEKGAYLTRYDRYTFVKSCGVERAVDPTGCGNSSTAASLVGLCEGYSDEYTVALSNAVATINARYVGPCPRITDELKKEAVDIAEELVLQAVVTKISR